MSGSCEPYHILFVDDDLIALELAERALVNERHCITCVSTGVEALRLLDVLDIDVVVIDLVMPEMDGIDLLRRIRRTDTFNHVPVIAVSSRANKETISEALASGACRFIAKPFAWDSFACEMRSVLTSNASTVTSIETTGQITVD